MELELPFGAQLERAAEPFAQAIAQAARQKCKQARRPCVALRTAQASAALWPPQTLAAGPDSEHQAPSRAPVGFWLSSSYSPS